MDLSPWDFWTADGKASPGTARDRRDARGACSSDARPSRREPLLHPRGRGVADIPSARAARAERLGALVPGAGHLVHMPAHIYMRIGRYADAEARQRARGARSTACTSRRTSPRASTR